MGYLEQPSVMVTPGVGLAMMIPTRAMYGRMGSRKDVYCAVFACGTMGDDLGRTWSNGPHRRASAARRSLRARLAPARASARPCSARASPRPRSACSVPSSSSSSSSSSPRRAALRDHHHRTTVARSLAAVCGDDAPGVTVCANVIATGAFTSAAPTARCAAGTSRWCHLV